MSAATLPAIDDHFWDWVLWLGSKQVVGCDDVVIAELGKLHAHLPAPLGVAAVPRSLGQAVVEYQAGRDDWEKVLQRGVSRTVETTCYPSWVS